MTEFVSKTTDETKKKREFKFQMFSHVCVEDEQIGWGIVILDRQEKKTTLGDKSSESRYSTELLSVIEGIKSITNEISIEDHKYISIELYTDSLYVVNLIREWLQLWTSDNSLSRRPNAELLSIINEYLKEITIKPKLIQKGANEYMWSASKIALQTVHNEEIVENL